MISRASLSDNPDSGIHRLGARALSAVPGNADTTGPDGRNGATPAKPQHAGTVLWSADTAYSSPTLSPRTFNATEIVTRTQRSGLRPNLKNQTSREVNSRTARVGNKFRRVFGSNALPR